MYQLLPQFVMELFARQNRLQNCRWKWWSGALIFAGYEREILDVITELKRVLNEKELLVTIRTVAEGGEKNGSRFDYFETIRKILEQQTADYVDVEASRDERKGKGTLSKIFKQ